MRKISETARELPEAKLEVLRENAIGILAECRRSFINDYPFYGSIAMNMDIVPTRDVRIPTAACDGKSIFFDIDFLSSLSPEHQKFVLAHEIMHAVMATALRQEGRNHAIFNVAADVEINEILAKDGLNVPPDACTCKNQDLPLDHSAEEYYEILSSNWKPPMPTPQLPGGSSGEPSDSTIGTSGNADGKIIGQFDKHFSISDDLSKEPIPENIADKYGKVGTDKKLFPNVTKANAEKMREITISAAQVYERQRGELPAHLKRIVDTLTKAEIPWQEVLSAFVTRTIGTEADWNRPNRRFVSSGTYLPSHSGEAVKLAVVIDTSGSTEDDIPKFLTEVNSLVSSFSSYTLTILQIDTEVNSCKTYTDDEPLDLESEKFEVNGGGGTRIYPAFKHIQDNDIEADAVVVLTDGYTEEFTEDMDIGLPTLWMITNDGNTENAKFGEICKFKSK